MCLTILEVEKWYFLEKQYQSNVAVHFAECSVRHFLKFCIA